MQTLSSDKKRWTSAFVGSIEIPGRILLGTPCPLRGYILRNYIIS